MVEPGGSSARLALSAAGFMATSTLGVSPGVTMSWSEMCTWNDDTPAIVPAGARISAGKFGSVAKSLPKAAESSVNLSPTSCIPSPESPANLMTTRSSVSAPRVEVASTVTVDHQLSQHSCRTARGLHRPRTGPQYLRRVSVPVLAASRRLLLERLEQLLDAAT